MCKTKTFPLFYVDDFCLNHKTNCSLVTLNNTFTLKIEIPKLLINKFPDVIRDSLNPVPMKTDLMHIYLKETYERPMCISTSWQIPKFFQPAAERCICDLLDKCIIEKLDYHMAGVPLPFSFQTAKNTLG